MAGRSRNGGDQLRTMSACNASDMMAGNPGRCHNPPIGTFVLGNGAGNSTPDLPLAGGFFAWLKSQS